MTTALPSPLGHAPDLRFRVVHGYRRAFRVAGAGPALVLVHGIGDSSATWDPVLPALARRHLVIAPDLLGHGSSDKPRADYSVAAYANGVRDLLGVLGVERATLVGHSLGGGVAMQFAYQFPERTERLVLVGSGGAGPDYLTRGMPTLLVWGARDAVVPVAHAHRAHRAMPGSRLEVFPRAGHFPFHTAPTRFVRVLEEFLAATAPATWSAEQWRQLLRSPTEAVSPAEAGERSAT